MYITTSIFVLNQNLLKLSLSLFLSFSPLLCTKIQIAEFHINSVLVSIILWCHCTAYCHMTKHQTRSDQTRLDQTVLYSSLKVMYTVLVYYKRNIYEFVLFFQYSLQPYFYIMYYFRYLYNYYDMINLINWDDLHFGINQNKPTRL